MMKRKVSKIAGSPEMAAQRRQLVLKVIAEIEVVKAEQTACTDEQRKGQLRANLSALRKVQNDLNVTKKPGHRGVKVPIPKSYTDARKETRDKALAISKRDKIVARFVQGGSPGSRGGGKR